MKKLNDISDYLELELPAEANLQLPDPNMMLWYTNFKDRTIWLDKEIDGSLFEECKLILQWNREDEKNHTPVEERKPIKIYIHSYGGDMDACFAFIDIMNLSKTPVYTINVNSALSAGCLIFINGHKGHRYCMPLSTALIHSGSGSNGGSFEQVVSQTENYKKVISMMRENILTHTNISKAMLTKNSKKEWYIYAEEQVKLGLADAVVDNLVDIF